MTKLLKKEKINYLKGAKTYLDNTISSDNINFNNITNDNNNINTTLANISNQLKNIAVIEKNKEFKLLNSSFLEKNKNRRNIRSNNIHSNIIDTSLNLENNQIQNKTNILDLTANSEINNKKFQGLKRKKVFNFKILKQINNEYDKAYYDEIKKENFELKENVKFLLKQIKKYQKSGLTIEDMNIKRQKEIENLEKQIRELEQDINKYKNRIFLLDNNVKKLIKENLYLKNYINVNKNKIKINLQKERQYKITNIYKTEINEAKKEKNFEQYYDIGIFDGKNKENNNLNDYSNEKKNNFKVNDFKKNKKLSIELLDDSYMENNGPNKNNFLLTKEYSNHASSFKKHKSIFSEGKLYYRKNIGNKFLSFNDGPYNTAKSKYNNFTYSKTHLKNNTTYYK